MKLYLVNYRHIEIEAQLWNNKYLRNDWKECK